MKGEKAQTTNQPDLDADLDVTMAKRDFKANHFRRKISYVRIKSTDTVITGPF